MPLLRYAQRVEIAVQAMSVATLVELINGWGTAPRAIADGRDPPPDAQFAASAATLEQVADRLYPVFAATAASDRARLVTDLLAECGLRPALRAADGRIRQSWLVPRKRDVLLATAAITLHAQLAEHDHERLGVCASTRCGDVYVDISPGAHRRFCSVTCQNRERVAAFRRRRAAGS
jgi:predicted RNA-binding Zn ribbon-like protein